MFSPNTRLAILEEKLSVYEELSKEMLTKLELAVDKISETNQNIAKVLVRHEERLDQTIQSDQAILKLLDEIKEQRKSDLLKFNDSLEEIKLSLRDAHKKISDLSKYRWIIAGALALVGFILAETNALSNLFNYDTNNLPEIHKKI